MYKYKFFYCQKINLKKFFDQKHNLKAFGDLELS